MAISVLAAVSALREARIAVWLRVVVSLLATASLASEFGFLFGERAALAPSGRLLLLQVVVAYLAIGLVCWFPLVAIPISWAALLIALGTGLPWIPCIAAWIVAVVALAVLKLPVGLVHVGFYLAWAVPMNFVVVEAGDRFWWEATLGMLPAAGIGLALRYFVVRQAESRRRLRELERRNETIRREERRALARELHDVVAHQLTLITMQVTSRWRSRDPDELVETLGTIDEAARSALVELRVLLDVLREDPPGAGERRGVEPTGQPGGVSVRRLVERLADSLSDLGFRVQRADVDPGADALPTSLVTTSTRIFQEAATNIIKHAPSGAVCELSMTIADGIARVRVVNDLPRDSTVARDRGREPARPDPDRPEPVATQPSGYGLQGMRERVAMLGGTTSVGAIGGRWVVDAELPVAGERAALDWSEVDPRPEPSEVDRANREG